VSIYKRFPETRQPDRIAKGILHPRIAFGDARMMDRHRATFNARHDPIMDHLFGETRFFDQICDLCSRNASLALYDFLVGGLDLIVCL
jgi:hypothetical protein